MIITHETINSFFNTTFNLASNAWDAGVTLVSERSSEIVDRVLTQMTSEELGMSALRIGGGLTTGAVCCKKAWNLDWTENYTQKLSLYALGFVGFALAAHGCYALWDHQEKTYECLQLHKDITTDTCHYTSAVNRLYRFEKLSCEKIIGKQAPSIEEYSNFRNCKHHYRVTT